MKKLCEFPVTQSLSPAMPLDHFRIPRPQGKAGGAAEV